VSDFIMFINVRQ